MDRWDQEPQDLVQLKRSKLKKLLAIYGVGGACTGVAFGLYFSGAIC